MDVEQWNVMVALASALLCASLAATSLYGDARSLVSRLFAAGMVAQAGAQGLLATTLHAGMSVDDLGSVQLALGLRGVACVLWLVFSLVYGRTNAGEILARRRFALIAGAGLTVLLPTVFHGSLLELPDGADGVDLPVLPLGWSGKLLTAILLLSAVMILVNFEGTLRASAGARRWRIKFLMLGLGSWFAVEIYLGSQAILYSATSASFDVVRAHTVLIGGLLVAVSFARNPGFLEQVYVSETVLYNSVIVLLAGGYLVIVGLLAELAGLLGGGQSLPLAILVVFVALVGLAMLLLSEELRQNLRRFVAQNFRRPRYDYRKEWTTLTQRTASLTDPRALSDTVARRVAEIFGVSAVTVWLSDRNGENAALGGSTILSDSTLAANPAWKDAAAALCRLTHERGEVTDLSREPLHQMLGSSDFVTKTEILLAVPLSSAGRFLGALTLSPRVTREAFSAEDLDLLHTVADQVAAGLLNSELSQHLARAREMEAFQTLSAFFVHDLKNLASMLSLTLQNLPAHFDNPEFRSDALGVISQSVAKMNAMCGQLSTVAKDLKLQPVETDLNAFVSETVAELDGKLAAPVTCDLREVQSVRADRDQLRKVLVNLLLNASDATGGSGEVRVSTGSDEGSVMLSVSDTGCGMSDEFVERHLFRPFSTTKTGGMGIGLFQSRRIVEAHRGKIEVQSQQGQGSTFRVILPAGPE